MSCYFPQFPSIKPDIYSSQYLIIWNKCWVKLISFESNSLFFSDSCTMQSTSFIPDHCVLKCMQILYDNKCCSNCQTNNNVWAKSMENKHNLLGKNQSELCLGKNAPLSIVKMNYVLMHFHSFLACKNDENSQKFYGNTTHFFEALGLRWCIGALNSTKMVFTYSYQPGCLI